MINNLLLPNVKIYVFGTLRVGERLDYYMEGSKPMGLYYTEGQLMKSENGNAYIDFDCKKTATIGELHHVNYYCLQRINHLENVSGEFPKGYDLDFLPVWPYKESGNNKFNAEGSTMAFFYKRRNNPTKILSGDWTKEKKPIEEIGRYLKNINDREVSSVELVDYMVNYLNS
jgi:gamma-glutamylcyclotransferase (GGCT)/AIG2-like uncharacterized protein YtfP